MSFTGPPGAPSMVGVPIANILAGMFGAYGVLAAIHERETSGPCQVVRTSLLAGVGAIHTFQGTRYLICGEVPAPQGNRHFTVAPDGSDECSDGIVQIAVGKDAIWPFAPWVGLDPDDGRFLYNVDRRTATVELDGLIGERLRHESVEVWLRRFAEHGVPAGEARLWDVVFASDQVISPGLVTDTAHATLGPIRTPGPPLRFGRSPSRSHLAPPTRGQHSRTVADWLEAEGR